MIFAEKIDNIKSSLELPLPGEEAQYLMAPKERKSKGDYLLDNTNPRLSSVLILLYPDEKGIMKTIFIQRPINQSVHSGQIAFPGGKKDDEDENLAATALRETEEEIGVASNKIEIIGSLSELYIPASNFLVQPFVGKIVFTPDFFPNQHEVKALLPAAIDEILSFSTDQFYFKTAYGNLLAPCYIFQGHNLWGATAMIVSEFREVIKKML